MMHSEEWVIWNGSLGILDTATIGRIEEIQGRRCTFLASPYGVVGPFNLEELQSQGRIVFGECLVMSRRRWQEDQIDLRREARKKRRAFELRFESSDRKEHRKVLKLPLDGTLAPPEINAAFRRLAKAAHPDAGGSNDAYRRIVEARDALLAHIPSSPFL